MEEERIRIQWEGSSRTEEAWLVNEDGTWMVRMDNGKSFRYDDIKKSKSIRRKRK